MNIEIKMDRDFERNLEELRSKYGEQMEILNGIHPSQLDFSEFIDSFVDKNNVADASIDSNANVRQKDIVTLLSEKDKSIDKMFGWNKIFYEIKKKYGLKTAKEWSEQEFSGGFYMHDFSTVSFKSYCFAYDLSRLAKEGLFFIDDYNNQPPKHLTTFFDDVIEFVSFMSNRSSGACGLSNILVWAFYFWKKDIEDGYYIKDPDYYIRQNFQKFIYRLGQPFLRCSQTAFTNVSIFDRNYFEALFGGYEYPDGTFAIDYMEEFIEFQKIFLEVVSDIRTENFFSYPVLTYSLLYKDGKFVDEDFARWCSDHNILWNDSNFFVSDNVGTLSNCCFSGDQLCLSRSSEGVNLMTFKELYESSYKQTRRNFTIYHNGSWVKGKVIRLPKRKMYKIVTANNKEMVATDNHIFPTYEGDKQVKDLTENDYLEFSIRPLHEIKESDLHLTYEEGVLLGAYLGDGSMYVPQENHKPTITFSLNEEKYQSLISSLEFAVHKLDPECNIHRQTPKNNTVSVCLRSREVHSFIRQYISGQTCEEKSLSMDVLSQSYEFRKGILDGYYMTDGGNSNRIYTTSEQLIKDIECLLTSLGLISIVNVSDRTNEPVIIRDQEFKRNFPLYCIRWYTHGNKRTNTLAGYKAKNNSDYFKIKFIEPVDYDDEYVYCFQCTNEDEPYFTLPNGVITHNCRLLSNMEKLDAFINSIGGTALSIGSVKVNTINLVRIAYESGLDEEKYLEILRERTLLCCKALDIVRHIIQRNIEKGLLPNFCDGGIEMDKLYSTCGLLGLYEAIEVFGYIEKDEFGNAYYTDKGMEFGSKIFEVINDVKDNFTDKYSFNVESVPKFCGYEAE